MKWPVLFFVSSILLVAGCKSHYDTVTVPFTAVKTANSLEHGKNLVFNICGQCHYNKSVGSFIGEKIEDLPGFMGTVYSHNLTDSKRYGIANYKDDELYYLLKTGIAKDGRFIPYMVRPNLADADINDIIVYLRSGDGPVKARDTMAGVTHLSFLGKLATKVSGKPLPLKRDVKRPSPDNKIAYGRYLVDIIGCYHCHSKSILSLNYLEPEKSKGYMAGGMKWKVEGYKIRASNLTPDKQTGIGNYSQGDFRKAVQDGEAPGGRNLHFPMRRFKHLNNEQCDAIYAYLMTLPPKEHKIKGH